MTIRVRTYRRGGYEVDIRFTWPDGAPFRARFRSPVTGRSASQRWGEAREMVLLRAGQPAVASSTNTKEVPRLAEFWPRFIDGHCRANRHKPSGIEGKESVYRVHLATRFGSRRLDSLRNEDIQTLKADMATKSAKTVNNVLTALSKCLKVAVEWDVMERVPCTIRLLKVSTAVPGWYEILEYQRLVEAAQKIDARIHIMVLLAGSAGMRRGEIMALKWSDLDLKRRLIQVQRSIWEGHETVPKGGKGRVVDMTSSLADALGKHRHLRGERVLYADDGRALTNKIVRSWLSRAQRAAGIEVTGAIHRLRHTFCSMLAAEGAPPLAIQELAGHSHITTTMKYMHLSPTTRGAAIALLDRAWDEAAQGGRRGDIVETEVPSEAKRNRSA
jgi:integrase